MAGLLKFLFILIIIYYAFKLIGRYLLPILMKRFVRKAQERMGVEPEIDPKKAKKKEGQINIDYVPKRNKKESPGQSGDYIDFEDVIEE